MSDLDEEELKATRKMNGASKEKMNKVYCVEGDPDYGCTYIADKNSKCARISALATWVAETVDNPYIDLRVTRCWSVKETDYEGELNISQINELGLSWWDCEKCDKEKFEILDDENYKCKNCGHIGKIPYVE